MLTHSLSQTHPPQKKSKMQEHTCTHTHARAHAQGLQGLAHRQQLELPPCIHQKDGCGAMEKSTVPQCPCWTDVGNTEGGRGGGFLDPERL